MSKEKAEDLVDEAIHEALPGAPEVEETGVGQPFHDKRWHEGRIEPGERGTPPPKISPPGSLRRR